MLPESFCLKRSGDGSLRGEEKTWSGSDCLRGIVVVVRGRVPSRGRDCSCCCQLRLHVCGSGISITAGCSEHAEFEGFNSRWSLREP